MPANSRALTNFPLRNSFADRVNDSDDLMPGHARILKPGPDSFLHNRVTVANAARLHFDPHPIAWRFGNRPFNNFKRPFCTGDLGYTHFVWHNSIQFLVL